MLLLISISGFTLDIGPTINLNAYVIVSVKCPMNSSLFKYIGECKILRANKAFHHPPNFAIYNTKSFLGINSTRHICRFNQRLASHTVELPSQHTVFVRKVSECCVLPLYFASRCVLYVDAAHEYFDLQS
jgi:hypothetical protein